jgi:subtilisin family serine protease
VRYATPAALRGLDVTLRVAPLHVAEVRTTDAAALAARPGIEWVRPVVSRGRTAVEGVRNAAGPAALQPEWQYAATGANRVPASVVHAAARVTIAVIDTGADLSAPDLAAKAPTTWSVISNGPAVTDTLGHGTFVASLAGGAVANANVLDGFGGDARLMVVQAASDGNDFTDVTEAAAIVWAVDHGAQIVNLSLGGSQTSQVEQNAIDYAAQHGALVVAAAGNTGRSPAPMYPAALLPGIGLVVGASTAAGTRAPFSSNAPYVDLLAPGQRVLGALSSASPAATFPRARLRGAGAGLYGYGSGTSYAAPEVAGTAALVWAANPSLTAAQVIGILRRTASRGGSAGPPGTGYGVVDVAAAVAAAPSG